jgi:hypothetical protein
MTLIVVRDPICELLTRASTILRHAKVAVTFFKYRLERLRLLGLVNVSLPY